MAVTSILSQGRLRDLPADWQENWKDEYTYSSYGDRARNQFGPEFGDVAIEPWTIVSGDTTLYGNFQTIASELYDDVGSEVKDILDWSVESAIAYATYCYDEKNNTSKMVLGDGTDLTGYILPRNGYYGSKGKEIVPKYQPSAGVAGFAAAFRQTGNKTIWDTLRLMLKNQDLGDVGFVAGENMNLNYATKCNDAEIMFAVMELYKYSGNADYFKAM